ncbi:MAG: DUF6133 family protein [Eubacteriales bacterium]
MMIIQSATKAQKMSEKFKNKMSKAMGNERGDQNVGQAIAILITVVLGALLLAGLYTLFDDVVLPTVTERVKEMFDYNG